MHTLSRDFRDSLHVAWSAFIWQRQQTPRNARKARSEVSCFLLFCSSWTSEWPRWNLCGEPTQVQRSLGMTLCSGVLMRCRLRSSILWNWGFQSWRSRTMPTARTQLHQNWNEVRADSEAEIVFSCANIQLLMPSLTVTALLSSLASTITPFPLRSRTRWITLEVCRLLASLSSAHHC